MRADDDSLDLCSGNVLVIFTACYPLGAELSYMPARLVTLDVRPAKFHRTEKENASKNPERSFFDVA